MSRFVDAGFFVGSVALIAVGIGWRDIPAALITVGSIGVAVALLANIKRGGK